MRNVDWIVIAPTLASLLLAAIALWVGLAHGGARARPPARPRPLGQRAVRRDGFTLGHVAFQSKEARAAIRPRGFHCGATVLPGLSIPPPAEHL
jgi:hypothetical protein